MKVNELIEKLQTCPQDADVYIEADLKFAEVELEIHGCFQKKSNTDRIYLYAEEERR